MPSQNVTLMEEIIRFVTLAQTDRFTVSDLCEQFGISRKTGYKHLKRYAAAGLKGLQTPIRRPHPFRQRTAAAMKALILAERRLNRTWGPKKLCIAWLCARFVGAPSWNWNGSWVGQG
jgi:transposase